MEEYQQLDVSWYAIHSIEALFTLMGPDVEQVTRTHSEGADVVTGTWKGGRIGTIRAIRPYSTFGAVVFKQGNNDPVISNNLEGGYVPLLQEIVKFMRTGIQPVPNDETLGIYTFMDAAQRSGDNGGIPVSFPK